MPRISFFLGIAIYLYYDEAAGHHAPHVHAVYGEYSAVFALADASVLAGALKPKQTRRVQSWIEAHRDELYQNWKRARNGEALQWIDPSF